MQWKVDFIQQRAMTSSVAEPRRNSKHFPKPNLHQKNATATVRWSAARLIHYSFLSPGESIASENCAQQIHETHWKLQWLQRASVQRMGRFFSTTVPNRTLLNQRFKSWTKCSTKLCPRLPYSPDLLPTDYHFFKHFNNFLQGKHFHSQQETENAFQEFLKPQSMDFYTAEINELISHWQKCTDCTGSYFV